ncbi:MAG: DEAD/DEAH box helicase [Deferribacterota bacterium]|nr:DEAD/DEAH box helicase [Deferribacterota bacterium]
MKSFEELGLSENILRALKKKGFEEPTPIQEKVIPLLLTEQVDIVGQAQTGTGKTAAFGLPLVDLLKEKGGYIQAAILTPTRELALQIAEELNSFKGHKNISITPIYGGQSMELQLKRLRDGVDIVVGTPGRIIDHLGRKTLDLGKIDYLIIDEADEMLNMGFIDEIEEILKNTNLNKRTLLFSATMPSAILSVAKKYMRKYEFVKVKQNNIIPPLTEQIYFEVNEHDKFEALCRIRDMEKEFYGLVFCRTKVEVDNVASKLLARGYKVAALHGDVSQFQREKILKSFKDRRVNILVATDVAARGLDINDVTHVINYAIPQNPESYIHRIGRTGRAGKVGTAITFVSPEEYRRLTHIKRLTNDGLKKKKLPIIEDVINARKNIIIKEVESIAQSDIDNETIDFAKEILKGEEPLKVIAALIKYFYKEELDRSKYSSLDEVNIEKSGKARLFVALGRQDDLAPKKLVEFIREKTGINPSRISEVQVFDKFSFISVPFEDAELILNYFRKNKNGAKPIVTKAKKRKTNVVEN